MRQRRVITGTLDARRTHALRNEVLDRRRHILRDTHDRDARLRIRMHLHDRAREIFGEIDLHQGYTLILQFNNRRIFNFLFETM